ncbi:hypothetical protein GCM10008171_29160 [Methylopila jiangsuensis]|uniref:Uncharacterized protein n=1 Tax=Methylopila jiangsuensis TaxID=586230 RepID=A0A9W6JIH7_9HYPH|nr:hypothetical protein [Methylopila jiangsuensis]MDR6284951.1 hypothetical protein [Methylopila jiangsuensis]GLK77662.1 hypothetical protein GCM10008171_29160 [Methylopila jiangsuensis]
MLVASERLPEDAAQRHGRLRDYFCDKDATATRTPDGWALELAWPGDPDRHVDPALDVGLAWWDADLRRQDMAAARQRSSRLLRCLYDSWTLASWAEWLQRSGSGALEQLTILHVDDHRDLDAPRLVADGDGWRDLISGAACDLGDPGSVTAAIESGAIGMGSFMTPFLAAAPQVEVRHLIQPPKGQRTLDFEIRHGVVEDDLIEPGAPRPAIELVPTEAGTGPGRYRMTPSLDDWLADLDGRRLLLHVDMDYFCNRYDGDSDWRSRDLPLDPPVEAIERRIDEVVAALDACGLIDRLEDAVVAYSPGFFPAEFWERADDRLTRGLRLDADRG